jgi:nucleotide-binding universal stress UspA family protein
MPTKQIIVAAIELDATAEEVWKLAETLLHTSESEIHFAHVVRATEADVRANLAATSDLLASAHANLQKWLAAHVDEKDPRVPRMRLTVALGQPAAALVQIAADVEADLLLLGTHGRKGVERLVLGSVASQVFRTAPCSVLVARPKDYSGMDKSPQVAPGGGENHHFHHGHTYHYHRAIPFTAYDNAISPTGISRGDVH